MLAAGADALPEGVTACLRATHDALARLTLDLGDLFGAAAQARDVPCPTSVNVGRLKC